MIFDQKLGLDLAIALGVVLLAITLRMMYARGLQTQFPWFVRYLWLVLGRAPLLLLLRPYRTAYFYSYWIAEALTVGLSLFVIFEIYRQVLSSSGFQVTRSSFFVLTVALLALAASVELFLDTVDSPVMLRAIFVLTRTVRLVQIGLFIALVAASLFFNFYWQSLPFGVALGYGLYATIELVVTSFRAALGPSGDSIFALTKVWSYQLAVLLWITFLWRHRAGHALQRMPPESIVEWRRGLAGYKEKVSR